MTRIVIFGTRDDKDDFLPVVVKAPQKKQRRDVAFEYAHDNGFDLPVVCVEDESKYQHLTIDWDSVLVIDPEAD